MDRILVLGKTEAKVEGAQRMRGSDSITNSMDMTLSNLWEIAEDGGAWLAGVLGVTKSRAQFKDWTTKQ